MKPPLLSRPGQLSKGEVGTTMEMLRNLRLEVAAAEGGTELRRFR
jgi:hypothetical protein